MIKKRETLLKKFLNFQGLDMSNSYSFFCHLIR